MTSGKDIQAFEEEQHDTLIEEFIELHKNEWDDFVQVAYGSQDVPDIDEIEGMVFGVTDEEIDKIKVKE